VCRHLAELYGNAEWAAGAAPSDDNLAAGEAVDDEPESWSYVQIAMASGVLLAVVAVCIRFFKKGSSQEAVYEKVTA